MCPQLLVRITGATTGGRRRRKFSSVTTNRSITNAPLPSAVIGRPCRHGGALTHVGEDTLQSFRLVKIELAILPGKGGSARAQGNLSPDRMHPQRPTKGGFGQWPEPKWLRTAAAAASATATATAAATAAAAAVAPPPLPLPHPHVFFVWKQRHQHQCK